MNNVFSLYILYIYIYIYKYIYYIYMFSLLIAFVYFGRVFVLLTIAVTQ